MYHVVTPKEVPNQPAAEDGATDAEDRADKKERVLHTRVPAVLEAELKRFAQSLRVPVSNLVRTILEDALEVADVAGETVESRLKRAADQLGEERERLKRRVLPDPLRDVFAFQALTLAQAATCAKCSVPLAPGATAHLALSDAPPRRRADRVFVCGSCLPKG